MSPRAQEGRRPEATAPSEDEPGPRAARLPRAKAQGRPTFVPLPDEQPSSDGDYQASDEMLAWLATLTDHTGGDRR